MRKKSSGVPRITPEVRAGKIYMVYEFADGPVRESLDAHIEREVQLRVRRQVDRIEKLAAKAISQAREDVARAQAKLGGAPSTPGRPHAGTIQLRHLVLMAKGMTDSKARTTLAREIAEELNRAGTDPEVVPDLRTVQRWLEAALPPLPRTSRKPKTT